MKKRNAIVKKANNVKKENIKEDKAKKFRESIAINDKRTDRIFEAKRAQREDEKRKIQMWKAMEKIKEQEKMQNSENEKEIQEFFKEIKEKINKNEELNGKTIDLSKYEELPQQKKQTKKQKIKSVTKKNNRISGNSFEILNSEEFKEMFNQFQEDAEER